MPRPAGNERTVFSAKSTGGLSPTWRRIWRSRLPVYTGRRGQQLATPGAVGAPAAHCAARLGKPPSAVLLPARRGSIQGYQVEGIACLKQLFITLVDLRFDRRFIRTTARAPVPLDAPGVGQADAAAPLNCDSIRWIRRCLPAPVRTTDTCVASASQVFCQRLRVAVITSAIGRRRLRASSSVRAQSRLPPDAPPVPADQPLTSFSGHGLALLKLTMNAGNTTG